MKVLKISIAAALALLVLPAGAQIYTAGTDDPALRWKSVGTAGWKVIYPEGADSLAREYAISLESFRRAVGRSIGFLPNGTGRGPVTAILHAGHAVSNGMVGWCPRRMELFPVPETYNPDPFPWIQQLASHESRHIAQVQNGELGWFRWTRYLTGELITGVFSGIYPGPAFLEGDAVTTETAVTSSGRGRTADFLEYWRAANLEGKTRSWWQWRYGVLSSYSPDHYRAGYVLLAGMRTVYDDPLFTWRYFDLTRRNFLVMHALQKTVRLSSGKKFERAFKGIDDNLTEEWTKEALERAPFTETKPVSETGKSFVSYSRMTPAPGGFYALRAGVDEAPSLVFFKDKGDGFEERRIRPFSSNVGTFCLSAPTGRLYWSEIIGDRRWDLSSSSEIRYLDTDGKARTLAGGRKLFNPAANPAGDRIAAVEYSGYGECRIVILDASDGRSLQEWRVPDGLDATECVWIGERLYASVIEEKGMSIVSVPGFEALLEARPVKINHLSSDGGSILFTCDRGGSNEAYRVDTASGKVLQLTSSKVGAKGAVRYGGGLLYTSVESGGVPVLYAPDAALRKEEADWNYRHEWIWAEKLSAQEEQLSGMSWEQMYPLVTSARKSRAFFSEGRPLEEIAGAEKTVSKSRKDRKVAPARRRFGDPDASPEGPVEVSEPRSYNKLAHLVRVHSWVPAFIDYDEIASGSFEKVVTESALGATALFQNTLGTLSGSAGVRLWQGKDRPFAGGQAQLNYYGFYPVLNATVDVGRSFARRYWVTSEDGTGGSGFAPTDVPLVASTLRAYVPWNLSSGGWIRGAVASVSWRITNDITSTGVVTGRTDAEHFVVEGIEPGELKLRNRATVSARYYAMRPTATSRIYPELGIGVEAGCRFAPGLAAISLPVSYLYTYGYLPGLLRRHGIRLSAAIERQDPASVLKEAVVNFTPRGYAQVEGVYGTISSYPWRSGVTVDYAFPFADLGWDFLCPEVYVRNLEATLHADYTRLWGRGGGESLLSAGADLAFKLGNFLWVPYDTRLGVGWNWNAPLGKGTWNFIIDIAL